MSRHVPPHRWGDAFAGKLGEDELAAIEQHADGCPRCARARDRVQRASQSFPVLRAQSAPDLGWDGVRARVHWAVSTEKHARVRQPNPRLAWLATGALVAGAAGLAIATGPIAAPKPAPIAVGLRLRVRMRPSATLTQIRYSQVDSRASPRNRSRPRNAITNTSWTRSSRSVRSPSTRNRLAATWRRKRW